MAKESCVRSIYACVSKGVIPQVWGVVRAPANFSQSLLKRLASAMDASNDTLSQSSVNVSFYESVLRMLEGLRFRIQSWIFSLLAIPDSNSAKIGIITVITPLFSVLCLPPRHLFLGK